MTMAMRAVALIDHAEKSMLFIANSSAEEELISDKEQIPKTVKSQGRSPGMIHQCAEQRSVRWIVNVDFSVTKVSNEERVAKRTEASRFGETPRRVQVSLGNESLHEVAARVEDIDKTEPRPGDIIMGVGILLGVSDKYLPVELANSIRRKSRRQGRIRERESCLQNKILIVRLNFGGVKIRHVKKIMAIRGADSRAFINCATPSVVHRDNRVGWIERCVVTRDRTIFADENERAC